MRRGAPPHPEINRRAPSVHQHKCSTGRPFSVSWGPPEQSPGPKYKQRRELSSDEKFLLLFRALSNSTNFQGKCNNALFARTVFATGKTHLGISMNTYKVGAQWAESFFLCFFFSAHQLVQVCWCMSLPSESTPYISPGHIICRLVAQTHFSPFTSECLTGFPFIHRFLLQREGAHLLGNHG